MSLVSSRETKAVPHRARESNDAGLRVEVSRKADGAPGSSRKEVNSRGIDQRQGDGVT